MKLRSRGKKDPDEKPTPAKKTQLSKPIIAAKNTASNQDTKKEPSPTDDANPDWLANVQDDERRQGFLELHHLIRTLAPKLEPTTDYHGLIGYGVYYYKYKSGRQGDHVKISLANNKKHMAIHCCGLKDGKYIVEQYADRLGKCSTGKSCVRFKRLSDLNRPTLEALISDMAVCEIMS